MADNHEINRLIFEAAHHGAFCVRYDFQQGDVINVIKTSLESRGFYVELIEAEGLNGGSIAEIGCRIYWGEGIPSWFRRHSGVVEGLIYATIATTAAVIVIFM